MHEKIIADAYKRGRTNRNQSKWQYVEYGVQPNVHSIDQNRLEETRPPTTKQTNLSQNCNKKKTIMTTPYDGVVVYSLMPYLYACNVWLREII